MWELVSRGSKMVGLREAALPFMEDVQSVVQHATTLGILDSDEVLYIERIGPIPLLWTFRKSPAGSRCTRRRRG